MVVSIEAQARTNQAKITVLLTKLKKKFLQMSFQPGMNYYHVLISINYYPEKIDRKQPL